MSTSLEDDLKTLLAEEARQAPLATGLALRARHQVRRRRRIQAVCWSGALVAASIIGVAVSNSSTQRGTEPGRSIAMAPSSTPPTAHRTSRGTHKGAVPMPTAGAAACAVYTPSNMAKSSDLAFDGTVTRLGPTRSMPSLGWTATRVTFKINAWYDGGHGGATSILVPTSDAIDPGAPPFAAGTRLLVSGQRVVGRDGRTVGASYAYGCGFTRYYDRTTAEAWRRATN